MASSSACALGEAELCSPAGVGKGGSGSRSELRRPEAFPRSCRLTAPRQFQAVYTKGRRAGCRSFTLFGVPTSAMTARLGITVTRRVGGSVFRNRVKRCLREIFRRHRAELQPVLDLVANVHPGIDPREFAQLETEFLSCYRRLARMRP
jgi:ribonuclease P protein component